MREISLNHNEFTELSTNILSQEGSLNIKVHGFSMYPFIRNGDIISIHPCNASFLRLGDVALYHVDRKKLVAHRIVGKHIQHGQIFLRMCADATLDYNEWIPACNVLGKIVSIQREQKVLHLDKGFLRFLSFFWAKCFPVSHVLFRLSCVVKKVVSRFFL